MTEAKLNQPWRAALRMGLLAALLVAGVAGVYQLTRDRIAFEQRQAALRIISEVLPPDGYDNEPLSDVIEVTNALWLGDQRAKKVYRARRGGEPVALAMQVTAPRGYNGPIELIVGIDYAGRLTGVRVVSHRETPGLGDAVDTDVSDWIFGFNGRSLNDPPSEQWAVKRDGGAFDQFTGATITPRAIVDAVANALEYFQQYGDELWER